MQITKASIQSAAEKITPYIHNTPVLTSQSMNELYGIDFYFKCENFQKIGAFKIRGAMNACLKLSPAQLAKGIATHSSGNHAQAMALAGKILETKAYIVMPNNSPQVKVNAVKGYGAEVTMCAPNQQARESTLQNIVNKTGAHFVHPYDNEDVIEGQATCVKELIEAVPELEVVITPVGGGGLLSGTCLAAHYFKHSLKVYAGEPEGAADAVLSLQSGKIEKAPYINTIADGLLTTLSERTLSIIKEHVTDIFLVTEAEIKATLKLVYERLKIVVEPSCVVPLAAAIKNAHLFKGKKVGIVLTGGNVDLTKFGEWFPSE